MPNQPKTQGRSIRVDDETWTAVKAEAERKGLTPSELVRQILRNALLSVPLLIALATLLAWGGREVQAPWGETQGPAFSQAQVAQWANQMIAEQVANLGCDTNQRMSPKVAVRNSTGWDRGVVRVLPLTDAFKQAKAGTVWIVGYCG